MAVLTRDDILSYVARGELDFTPGLDSFQLQAHAVDLRLGFTFLIPRSWHVTKAGREQLHMDYYAANGQEHFDVLELKSGQFFDLMPGEHIMVSSLEMIKMPNDLMAVMYPRTSTNRKGLSVDQTGIVDCGYEGKLVIPVRNNTAYQTVRLYPGERFCQLVFERLTQTVSARKSRYHLRNVAKGVNVDALTDERLHEIAMIQSGDVDQLKSEFSVPIPKLPD